jgi:hypothetical protein
MSGLRMLAIDSRFSLACSKSFPDFKFNDLENSISEALGK